MDIGKTVIVEGRRFTIRGFDPAGVDPRFVYLEDTRTRSTIAMSFADLSRAVQSTTLLRLVDDEEHV